MTSPPLTRPRLGDHAARFDAVQALLASGRVTTEQVLATELVAADRDIPVLQALVESGLVSQSDVVCVTAEEMGFEFVELTDYPWTRGRWHDCPVSTPSG